ncbi:unnamed protein product [Menidia menidia]|uniref:T-cell surface glycoprotein CD8 alpha chain n=1 Tax=Menidia menidia TaxID=238744 RepID=A0A8S4BFR8_9TELE|nr:unnamed protein product [Menidia menidia]
MDQNWIQVLLILVCCHNVTPGAAEERIVKVGDMVDINCQVKGVGTMVIWFRVLDHSGMEFIASFSPAGSKKSGMTNYESIFSHKGLKSDDNALYTLSLKSFKSSDSGIYSCGLLIKGNELSFGEVTRLLEEKKEEPPKKLPPFTGMQTPTTTTRGRCPCGDQRRPEPSSLSLFCTPIILGPLVGGCLLLLLLLLIITLYCNHMRTRRCPHHYKRKPRTGAPEKLMMTNRNM